MILPPLVLVVLTHASVVNDAGAPVRNEFVLAQPVLVPLKVDAVLASPTIAPAARG